MSEPEKKKKKKKKAKGTCRALHDYEKQNPDELSFAQDDIITIVNDKNEGWWIGRLPSGDEGWFPVNFTEIVDAPKKKVFKLGCVAVVWVKRTGKSAHTHTHTHAHPRLSPVLFAEEKADQGRPSRRRRRWCGWQRRNQRGRR